MSTPEKRIACSFEPISAVTTPKGVRVSTSASGRPRRANRISGIGTPKTVPLPMNTMAAGKPEMTLPCVMPIAMPLTSVMVPSVARIGETRR